jgi:hypothetical protein
MGLLKIRNADGSIQIIATMKGDKGDGVPNGGTKGQVMRKTEDGTEWADLVKPEVVLTNSDTSVSTATITQDGLYEITVFENAATNKEYSVLMSVSDLGAVEQRVLVSLRMETWVDDSEHVVCQWLTISCLNGTISTNYRHVSDTGTTDGKNHASIRTLRLILPYA